MGGQVSLDQKELRKLLARFRVESGRGFDLQNFPTDSPGSAQKDDAEKLLQHDVKRLTEMQELLYADARWSLLLIFQAMDAGGKDGTIKHVMAGVNPQGVTVTSFKQPNPEELSHDFLWRIHRALPARGMIGIFNRSHYEEVVVTRVHPDLIASQHLPHKLADPNALWSHRIKDIRRFETYLSRQGTRILKFFLHVSPEEQRERLLARLDEPKKTWKFDPGDLAERRYWTDYMAAYQHAIAGTATSEAPWLIVPADQKWFARLIVGSAINAALEDLDLAPPKPDARRRAELAGARKILKGQE